MKFGLRTALLLGFGTIVFLTIGATQIFTERNVAEFFINKESQQQVTLSKFIAQSISYRVLEKSRDVETYARYTIPELATNHDKEELRAALETLLRDGPDFSWVGFTDSKGVVVAATGGHLEGLNVSARPWFAGAQKGLYIGDIHDALLLANLLGKPEDVEPIRFTDYASPVFDNQGQLMGVLAAHASYQWIGDVIESKLALAGTEGIEAIITDGEGRVHYPHAGRLDLIDLNRLQITEGFSKRKWPDGEFYTVATPVFNTQQQPLDWMLITRQSSADVENATNKLKTLLIMIGVLAFFLSAILIYTLLQLVTQPLTRLAQSANAVMAGERNQMPITSSKITEIHTLAESTSRAFSQIAAQRDSLEALNEDLDREVRVRTAELNKSFEDLSELQKKGHETYAAVAHELRTPTATIHMMAESEEDWPKARHQIRSLSEQLMLTLDDIRMAINPTLERPIRPVDTTIHTLMSSILSLVASTVRDTGVELEYVEDTDPRIRSTHWQIDTYRVRVAVSNLIKNACIHSEGKLVSVHVKLDGNELVIRVSDDGKGIPAEKVETLFKAFERGDTKSEGTGMGLFITREWIQEIGGTVTYSPLSRGSEFTLRAPLGTADLAPDAINEDVFRAKSAIFELNVHGIKVSLVDDDRLLRRLGERLLTRYFDSVSIFQSGAEALQNLEDTDVLITDFLMPQMDGIELPSSTANNVTL